MKVHKLDYNYIRIGQEKQRATLLTIVYETVTTATHQRERL
jgi:hypothetical protein